MKSYLYHIKAISNLHVGSGEANDSVIDNLIQRDAVSTWPIINSSSLKGALREHCKDKPFVESVLGSDVKSRDKRMAGNYGFFDAGLLAMPVRADKAPYFMATSPAVLADYLFTLNLFGIQYPELLHTLSQAEIVAPVVWDKRYEGARIEDLNNLAKLQTGLPDLASLIGHPCLLLPDEAFMKLCDDNHLPVIARNYLNNGKSENLWYEQVLPRYSLLYFTLVTPEDDGNIVDLHQAITSSLVQIGANATVGYGFCQLERKGGNN